MRIQVALALGQIPDLKAMHGLIQVYKYEKVAKVKNVIIQSLKFRSKLSVKEISKQLKSSYDVMVQKKLIYLLSQMNESSIVNTLSDLYAKHNRTSATKVAILKAVALYPLSDKSSLVCANALNDTSELVKRQAIRTICALKATSAIPKMIELISSKDEDEVLYVLDGLSLFDSDEVINALIKLFYHNNREIKEKAKSILVKMSLKSIPYLLIALEKKDSLDIRTFASQALYLMNTKSEIQLIINSLDHNNEKFAKLIAQLLIVKESKNVEERLIATIKNNKNIKLRKRALWVLSRKNGNNISSQIIKVMQSNNSEKVRAYAASLLYLFDNDTTASMLALTLKKDSDVVAKKAIKSLLQLNSPEAKKVLLQFVMHKSKYVRRMAFDKLKSSMLKETIDYLILHLSHKNNEKQKHAVEFLIQINDIGEPYILDALKNNDKLLHKNALLVLTKIKNKNLNKFLFEYLSKKGDLRRRTIITILIANDKKNIPNIIKTIQKVTFVERIAFLEVISQIKNPLAISILTSFFIDKVQEVRKYALMKVRERKSTAIPYLKKLIEDKNPLIRVYVIRALGKIDDAKTIPLLILGFKDPDIRIQKIAYNYILDKDFEAQSFLEKSLRNTNILVRRYSIMALGKYLSGILFDEDFNNDGINIVKNLIPILYDSDEVNRGLTKKYLLEREDIAIEPIMEAMLEKTEEEKEVLQSILSTYSSEKRIKTYLNCLADKNAKVQTIAIQELVKTADLVVPNLITVIDKKVPPLYLLALKVLSMIHTKYATLELFKLKNKMEREHIKDSKACAIIQQAILKTNNEHVFENLISGLRAKDEGEKKFSREMLKSKGKHAVPSMIKLLDDKDTAMKIHAIKLLGETKDTRATKPLIKLLMSTNKTVQKETAIALNKIAK